MFVVERATLSGAAPLGLPVLRAERRGAIRSARIGKRVDLCRRGPV